VPSYVHNHRTADSTRTGFVLDAVMPSPSWPNLLSPQQYAVLGEGALAMPQVCNPDSRCAN